MKAVIYKKYGAPEVLELSEINNPSPKDNEILVKIVAATVTSGDIKIRASDFPALFWIPARLIFGIFKPRNPILGHEFSGIVEAIGKDVQDFSIGDEVFGTTTMLKGGSYAEYVCVPESWKHGVVAKKPKGLSYQESAALPIGAMTALFLLEKAKIREGLNVLIYGASGSVGSYAVQIARILGAHVTAVCSSENSDIVTALGAETVIDYKSEDYTHIVVDMDIVLDAVGFTSKSDAKKVLKAGGQFVSIKMLTDEKIAALLRIKEWAEAGKLKAYIDKVYPLEEIVEAHRYVDTGRKRGNVVLDIP